MQKIITEAAAIKLVGITTRTNNATVFAVDPATNPIAATVQKYFHNQLANKINNRKNPGITFCVYTNYESDMNGDYTYLIGEEVTNFDSLSEGFETLAIPAQNYAKFTNQPGPMPDVCVNMWQKIWQMNDDELGGKRSYIADFEIYDELSVDHNNVTLNIFIGVSK